MAGRLSRCICSQSEFNTSRPLEKELDNSPLVFLLRFGMFVGFVLVGNAVIGGALIDIAIGIAKLLGW